MLKVRDDFDLEKLKDYGFKKEYSINVFMYEYKYFDSRIEIIDRGIYIDFKSFFVSTLLDKLYDLIKDGVVIKV